MSLSALYAKALNDTPDKAAIIFKDTVTSYRTLAADVDLSARRLLAAGVTSGDRVAVFMRSRTEFIELYLACFRIGAVAVPLNHRFQTDEVTFACNHCGAKLLITDGRLYPRIQDVKADIPTLEAIYVYGDVPAILDTAMGRAATQQLTPDDVSLAATAICHGGGSIGVTFPTLYAGGSVVILEESDPVLFLDALARHRPTRTLLLPAQPLDAVESPHAEGADFGCLREVQCGGDQISPDLYAQFAKVTDLELNQAYGMTECEGCSMSPPFGIIERGSIGQPREGVEIRLVRDGQDVADGEIGEILIRSASVMAGYWDDPENTEAVFVDDWLRTGDLGRRDHDGYYFFEGSIKEVIIKGGSNISHGEVEDVLNSHPPVDLSGVVEASDPRLGAIVHAFVQPTPGSASLPSEHELVTYASDRLAAYTVPDRWTLVTDLPRNDVGKIDRKALHARAAGLDAPV
ncbi:class I adenylate-forming enzyme family protein [Microbacterium sp. AK031]|uniref:class I adenylate-forming enzyme family protein n=1 Tax=Microbacterium sp. AK031 TaxID=2723076 RepID=UPI002169F6D7|nr:AMP-binding protein [Microbacterium sp. AK031]MCS3843746.1 acyl-CoA synthetase (AMP-forming)/AMP-acid ligase II [Microbacterium sp. AK031]